MKKQHDDMKRWLLVLRMTVEGLYGFLVVVNAPRLILRAVHTHAPTSYFVGGLLAVATGVLLILDAVRVRNRLKVDQPPVA